MNARTNVLAIEDDEGDREILRRYLLDVPDVKLEYTDRLSTGLKLLPERQVDLVLLDLGLPDSQGIETLARFRSQVPDTPVVVLTSFAEEALVSRSLSWFELSSQYFSGVCPFEWVRPFGVVPFYVEHDLVDQLPF